MRVEPELVGDALTEDLVDDEVDRAESGQQVPGDGEACRLRQQLPQQVHGQGVGQPSPLRVGAHPHPDIGAAALVAAAAEPRLPTHANRNEARRGFASIDGLQYRRQPVLIPGGVKNSDWRPWGCEPILRA